MRLSQRAANLSAIPATRDRTINAHIHGDAADAGAPVLGSVLGTATIGTTVGADDRPGTSEGAAWPSAGLVGVGEESGG